MTHSTFGRHRQAIIVLLLLHHHHHHCLRGHPRPSSFALIVLILTMSWDYTRIYQNSNDPDGHREKVLRDMTREKIQAEEQQGIDKAVNDGVDRTVTAMNGDSAAAAAAASKGEPYSTGELLKQAAFGGCIGTITGAVFGFMDGMRTAGESAVLKKASDTAKGKYILEGTTRSATVFGVFFGGFHVVCQHYYQDPVLLVRVFCTFVIHLFPHTYTCSC